MEIITKANGFTAENLQNMIAKFNKAAEKLFPDCNIEHFYYGNGCDMVTIILKNKHYGDFSIGENRVSFNGHTCSMEEYQKFGSLTYNDELFEGKLLDIAN